MANIEGDWDEFELFNSKTFIGFLPSGNFMTDLKLERSTSKVSSKSKINFTTLDAFEITGSADQGFTSEALINLSCTFGECEFSDFNLTYQIDLDDEWLRGSAYCSRSSCSFSDLDHLVRTSNTVNVFKLLNQANIVNPLSSLYLFGAISSGQKINAGHELKF